MESLKDWLERTNQKINVLYVYGFNSNANSSTAKSLKKYLGKKFDVKCLPYDQENPTKGLRQLKSYVDHHNIDIVIGTSLGGFFTAHIKDVTKVMINPALHPSSLLPTLSKNELPKSMIDGYVKLEDIKPTVDAEERSCAYGLFGTRDDIVNNKSEFDSIYNFSEKIPTGHHLSDSDVKTYLVPFIFTTVLNAKQRRVANESIQAFNEAYITEHFVNLFDEKDKLKYGKEVWDILTQSYAAIGGMAGMKDVQQLIDETDMWKLVRRGGKIVAVATYTGKRGGRKMCYCGQDGTEQGKLDLFKIMYEDNKLLDRQAWGEYSGAMVSSQLKQGAFPIPAVKAKEIMANKPFVDYKPDGYFYTRKIGSGMHTKIMLGHYKDYEVAITDEQIKMFKELAKKYSIEDEKMNQ